LDKLSNARREKVSKPFQSLENLYMTSPLQFLRKTAAYNNPAAYRMMLNQQLLQSHAKGEELTDDRIQQLAVAYGMPVEQVRSQANGIQGMSAEVAKKQADALYARADTANKSKRGPAAEANTAYWNNQKGWQEANDLRRKAAKDYQAAFVQRINEGKSPDQAKALAKQQVRTNTENLLKSRAWKAQGENTAAAIQANTQFRQKEGIGGQDLPVTEEFRKAHGWRATAADYLSSKFGGRDFSGNVQDTFNREYNNATENTLGRYRDKRMQMIKDYAPLALGAVGAIGLGLGAMAAFGNRGGSENTEQQPPAQQTAQKPEEKPEWYSQKNFGFDKDEPKAYGNENVKHPGKAGGPMNLFGTLA